MEIKLDSIQIFVSDIEKAKKWYSEILGMALIGGRTPIIFKTKNIKKTVEELKLKSVKFVEEISKRPWGQYKAVFTDPDGNEFNLVQS